MTAAATTLRRQIDLPADVAAWVLGAHAFTLATPVVLLAVAWDRRERLDVLLDRPVLLLVAAALLLAGSAFEVAQNTVDRWFYTGPYPALVDLLFTALITAGLGTLAMAATDAWWAAVGAVGALALTGGLYLAGNPAFAGLGVAGVTATVALLDALDHPGVVLLLVANGFGSAFFLALVERTHAQSFHGAIALSNGLGTLVVVWAVIDAAAGRSPSWAAVAAAAAVLIGMPLAASPWLRRRQPTRRPSSEASSPSSTRS